MCSCSIAPLFRFVPDNTRFAFMRARFYGLAGSFILSALSIGLFFYPGLRLGLDFKGGITIEARTPGAGGFQQAARRVRRRACADGGIAAVRRG